MNKKHSYSEDVKLLKYIQLILSAISSLLSILSFFGYTSSKKLFMLILLIILIFTTIIIVFKRKEISAYLMIKLLNFTIPCTNVEIYDKIVNYEYISETELLFESMFKIKVNYEPINHINDRIKWTAGAVSQIDPVINGQTIELIKVLSPNQVLLDKQDFTIRFEHNREITKQDDPILTGFRIKNLYDHDKKAKPILCIGIYDKTFNITLRVTFNKNLNPTNIRFMKYSHFIDTRPYETEPVNIEYDSISDKKYVEYNIKTPIYGGKYVFDWVL